MHTACNSIYFVRTIALCTRGKRHFIWSVVFKMITLFLYVFHKSKICLENRRGCLFEWIYSVVIPLKSQLSCSQRRVMSPGKSFFIWLQLHIEYEIFSSSCWQSYGLQAMSRSAGCSILFDETRTHFTLDTSACISSVMHVLSASVEHNEKSRGYSTVILSLWVMDPFCQLAAPAAETQTASVTAASMSASAQWQKPLHYWIYRAECVAHSGYEN